MKFKLEDIMAYRIINTDREYLFGYEVNTTKNITSIYKRDYKKTSYYETLEFELNLLMETGFLEVSYNAEPGDKCYFWNIQGGKMDSMIDGGPFISILEKETNGRYSPEEEVMTFLYCEKVYNTKRIERCMKL